MCSLSFFLCLTLTYQVFIFMSVAASVIFHVCFLRFFFCTSHILGLTILQLQQRDTDTSATSATPVGACSSRKTTRPQLSCICLIISRDITPS